MDLALRQVCGQSSTRRGPIQCRGKECVHVPEVPPVPDLADPFAASAPDEPPVEGINPKDPPPEPMPG
jgi:hypothetical protein